MATIVQRLVQAVDHAYERRIRAASLITDYNLEQAHGRALPPLAVVEDSEGNVIANVTPGTELGRRGRRTAHTTASEVDAPRTFPQREDDTVSDVAPNSAAQPVTLSPAIISALPPSSLDLVAEVSDTAAMRLTDSGVDVSEGGESSTQQRPVTSSETSEHTESAEAEISNIAPGARRRRVPPPSEEE
jgi:hypothetical protein